MGSLVWKKSPSQERNLGIAQVSVHSIPSFHQSRLNIRQVSWRTPPIESLKLCPADESSMLNLPPSHFLLRHCDNDSPIIQPPPLSATRPGPVQEPQSDVGDRLLRGLVLEEEIKQSKGFIKGLLHLDTHQCRALGYGAVFETGTSGLDLLGRLLLNPV